MGQAQKKKENPYLSHHRGGSATKSAAEVPVDPSVPAAPSSTTPLQVHDERIKTSSRDLRAKKAFNFIEAGLHLYPLSSFSPFNLCTGTFVKHADQQRFKEERKIIAGYSSGRRAPEMIVGEDTKTGEATLLPNEDGELDPEEGRELVSDNALKIFVRSLHSFPP